MDTATRHVDGIFLVKTTSTASGAYVPTIFLNGHPKQRRASARRTVSRASAASSSGDDPHLARGLRARTSKTASAA